MPDNRWPALGRRVAAVHALWQLALDDMTPEQINHHERPGVLPIAFSFFHYVNGEDRNVSERLLGAPPLWDAAWGERTGIAAESLRRGTPIAVAEQVRLTDLDAWRAYQTAVFARTDDALAAAPAGRFDEVVYEQLPDALRGGFVAFLAGDGPVFLGDLMDAFLYQHGIRHIGEIEHARSLVGLQGLS